MINICFCFLKGNRRIMKNINKNARKKQNKNIGLFYSKSKEKYASSK